MALRMGAIYEEEEASMGITDETEAAGGMPTKTQTLMAKAFRYAKQVEPWTLKYQGACSSWVGQCLLPQPFQSQCADATLVGGLQTSRTS